MYQKNDGGRIPAQVPGSVFHDLMENGLMEDPFYRDNEKKARELSFHDYVYEREFELAQDFLKLDRIELCCEGLDTLTDIFMNGIWVGKTDNMFRLYEIDVKHALKAGINTIRIEFTSASGYAQQENDKEKLFQFDYAMPGMGHIRKGHYMFGWDWGPQLPDMGIYRPISLKGYEAGKITDVRFRQEHKEGSVNIGVKTEAEIWSEGVSFEAEICSPKGEKKKYAGAAAECEIRIENPLLWWPCGHGKQNLYQVEIRLVKDGTEVDRRHYQIGLRTMELVREKDEWGTSFYFRINGVPVYMKGADYIPEDNILPRCNYDRTRRLLLDCVECNHNAIRVWGGGIYPEEYFYDLCDELGIVVWQDLMFACATYPSGNPEFMETTQAELKYNMGRIRHRACLGLICGNNEMELAHVDWAMENREENKKKYLRFFEQELPALAKEAAPDVAYWLASPSSGGGFGEPNGEEQGDMHYWGVWHMCEPFVAYRTVNPRFMSEFGIQSFPCLKTMETCTLPEDRNIFSRIMELHQKGGPEGNERILNYISQMYRYPRNFESLLYISQMIQAEGIRYGVEYWRRIYGRCMGTVYWQLNDCWPVASWAGIDSCGRWKALHYFSRKFFAPLLVSVNDEDKRLAVYVTNDRNREYSLELCWGLYRFDGARVKGGVHPAVIGACRSAEVMKLDFRKDIVTREDEINYVFRVELKENGTVLSENQVYFAPVKYMELTKPEIGVTVTETEKDYILGFKTDTLVKGLYVDFTDYDFVLSDNFFDLIPGIEKKVLLSRKRAENISGEELKEKMKLFSVVDTYE